jgi:hypothetical protein
MILVDDVRRTKMIKQQDKKWRGTRGSGTTRREKGRGEKEDFGSLGCTG